MSGIIDNETVEIPCSKCGRKTKKSIKWIKSHSAFSCGCGSEITIDAKQARSEFKKIDRSIADFEKTIKNFGK